MSGYNIAYVVKCYDYSQNTPYYHISRLLLITVITTSHAIMNVHINIHPTTAGSDV